MPSPLYKLIIGGCCAQLIRYNTVQNLWHKKLFHCNTEPSACTSAESSGEMRRWALTAQCYQLNFLSNERLEPPPPPPPLALLNTLTGCGWWWGAELAIRRRFDKIPTPQLDETITDYWWLGEKSFQCYGSFDQWQTPPTWETWKGNF